MATSAIIAAYSAYQGSVAINTCKQPPLWLLTILIMFPQLVETIYSPALPDIARAFQAGSERAAQTLSVYFIAFAVGVALWGWLSDRIGRRPAMIAVLLCYGTGSALALVAPDFSVLLLARMVAAMGAAAGSVVVQTMLRDSYESTALARVFSVMGAALAISPVFGLVSGGWLVSLYGHTGVFVALVTLALVLLTLTALQLPETRSEKTFTARSGGLVYRMAGDGRLWKNAMLVALLNTMLFSYYSLAPFPGLAPPGFRMDGHFTGCCHSAGQPLEPETVVYRFVTRTTGEACLPAGPVIWYRSMDITAICLNPFADGRGCGGLWHRDSKRPEPGPEPVS